jgi:hypothetical protein
MTGNRGFFEAGLKIAHSCFSPSNILRRKKEKRYGVFGQFAPLVQKDEQEVLILRIQFKK